MNKQLMRVVLVDDEPPALVGLQSVLQKAPGVEVVGVFQHSREAIDALSGLQPNILFLDIEMPGPNGFDVARSVEDTAIQIVFVTAYDHYAVKAFQVEAIDYILKPFEDAQIFKTLDRIATRRHPDRDAFDRMLKQIDTRPTYLQRLVIKDGQRSFIVPVAEIQWISSARNYVEIKTAYKTYLHRESLDHLEKNLNPQQFVRIHRSTMIHLDDIAMLEKTGKDRLEAVTKDGRRFSVSARYKPGLEEALG